jgi:hypothetical protein
MADVRGGKSLLTNGTFASGASTGWTLTNASGAASGDDLLITPSSSSWKIAQSITGICKYGKRYIAVAKFLGTASFALGDAAGGTTGRRPLLNFGVSNLYEDGDTLSLISFEYLGQWGEVSLGSLSSSSAATVRWILLIEV